jgi:hypothetical protein
MLSGVVWWESWLQVAGRVATSRAEVRMNQNNYGRSGHILCRQRESLASKHVSLYLRWVLLSAKTKGGAEVTELRMGRAMEPRF